MIAPFEIARLPAVVFGEGAVRRIPELAATFGRRALVVTGARSFRDSRHWSALVDGLGERGVGWDVVTVEGEPSPERVDRAVAAHRDGGVDVVLGIGGGSVLDAAKAIAGLLRTGRAVLDHLEGVGGGVPYTGPAVPLVAAPTTAGTGSEATKNAVIGVRGPDGFKKSFRDERLVARYAVVDPDLLESCPRELVAADGMDALTQLLESYVSTRSNPMTDALAESGLARVRDGLLAWYEGSGDAREARSRMAYAALVSGITLAQTGLGAVHGLASPIGAHSPAPHGAVCGCLVAEATAANVEALRARDPDGPALSKYARAASMLAVDGPAALGSPDVLVDLLRDWTERLRIPRLRDLGVDPADVARLVAESRGSSMKTNPIVLTDDEVERIVRSRL